MDELDQQFEKGFPQIVARTKWKATNPLPIDLMKTPVQYVFLTYAGAVDRCADTDECIKAVQDLQKFHMDHGAPDLPYNFLVGGDNKVYEGRGWDRVVPPPKERPDLFGKCLVFAFVGPMKENYEPKIEDFEYAYKLIHYGLNLNKINEERWFYRLMAKDWNVYNK